jgi:hypothetical protein
MLLTLFSLLSLFFCTFGQKEWIFGYGSLISQSSRASTFPDIGTWRAVRVIGINRGWYAPGSVAAGWSSIIGQEEQLAPTYLGAYIDNSTLCNGVIFEVNATSKAAFDLRELTGAGYNVEIIATTAITPLVGPLLNDTDIVYFYNIDTSLVGTPTEGSPIVTSYVDLILTATLDIDTQIFGKGATNFSDEFVRTTQGWSGFWINDRLVPRRPWTYQPLAITIDKILANNIDIEILKGISYDQVGLDELTAQVAELQTRITALEGNLKNGQTQTTIGVLFLVVIGLMSFFVKT